MRKLVTVRKISSLEPIKDADRIETATVDGWKVVVRKGEFEVGQHVLYFEVDSWLPVSNPLFAHLEKSGTKVLDNVHGAVLRTIKLRGQVSQGLILELPAGIYPEDDQSVVDEWMRWVGIRKWEDPIPAGSNLIGQFPSHIKKTDAERVQNLSDKFLQSLDPEDWFATEKIDGMSATFWCDPDGKLHAASRNYEVSLDSGPHAEILKSIELTGEGRGWIQGEIYGEGIQGNPLNMKGKHFSPFNSSEDFGGDIALLANNPWVKEIDLEFPQTIQEAVAQANGMQSFVSPKPGQQTEGIVWWHQNNKVFDELGGRSCFKAINNKFLLKENK